MPKVGSGIAAYRHKLPKGVRNEYYDALGVLLGIVADKDGPIAQKALLMAGAFDAYIRPPNKVDSITIANIRKNLALFAAGEWDTLFNEIQPLTSPAVTVNLTTAELDTKRAVRAERKVAEGDISGARRAAESAAKDRPDSVRIAKTLTEKFPAAGSVRSLSLSTST